MPPHQENKEVCSYKGHDHGVNDCPYRKCEHNDIGRRVISHEGITHPAGNQLCLDCGKHLTEIMSDLLKEKSTEIEEELKKLKDWEELQVGESEQIDECIKIIKKILR